MSYPSGSEEKNPARPTDSGAAQRSVADPFPEERDVLTDGPPNELRVLRDERNLPGPTLRRVRIDRAAVHQDAAARCVPETEQQLRQRRLAAPGPAREPHHTWCSQQERRIPECVGAVGRARIAVADGAEIDLLDPSRRLVAERLASVAERDQLPVQALHGWDHLVVLLLSAAQLLPVAEAPNEQQGNRTQHRDVDSADVECDAERGHHEEHPERLVDLRSQAVHQRQATLDHRVLVCGTAEPTHHGLFRSEDPDLTAFAGGRIHEASGLDSHGSHPSPALTRQLAEGALHDDEQGADDGHDQRGERSGDERHRNQHDEADRGIEDLGDDHESAARRRYQSHDALELGRGQLRDVLVVGVDDQLDRLDPVNALP